MTVTTADRYLESCPTTADAVEGLSDAVARLYADADPESEGFVRVLVEALARATSAAAALDAVTS